MAEIDPSTTLTVTAAEFDRAERAGGAGSAAALGEHTMRRWRGQFPDWEGRHWSYTDAESHPAGARHLCPINVTASC